MYIYNFIRIVFIYKFIITKSVWVASGNCDNEMTLSKKYWDQGQCHELICIARQSLASQHHMFSGGI